LTGAGLFAESQKFGEFPQVKESGVFGCDSVQTSVYNGRLFWIWGDTTLAHYPLGIFHTSAATTDISPFTTFEPPLNMTYHYFTDDVGKPRGTAAMPGDGPTWLSGLVTLPDKEGTQKLVAVYAKIKPPLEAYEYGLCVWNDAKKSFERLRSVWTKQEQTSSAKPFVPEGHAAFWTDQEGKRWALFGDPFPRLRCPATYEAWQNPDSWEKLNPPKKLISAKDNTPVEPHSGSIAWNEYRQRWVAVFMQNFGKPAVFGEIWYAESDSPIDGWNKAVKILSHGNYTFYNPCIHAENVAADSKTLSSDSKFLLFEGTFTAMFADQPPIVPRYDYTQILYRLDLDDKALLPAQK